jgi:hypothetical protein
MSVAFGVSRYARKVWKWCAEDVRARGGDAARQGLRVVARPRRRQWTPGMTTSAGAERAEVR